MKNIFYAIYEGCRKEYELWKNVNPKKSQEELYKALEEQYNKEKAIEWQQ